MAGVSGTVPRYAHPYPVGVSDTRLDEYDQLEWWDVARRLHPTMTWEQFQRDWEAFQCLKRTTSGRHGWSGGSSIA